MDILAWILTSSIIAGQLIKIPIGTHGGATLLDATVISLLFWGMVKLRFHLKKPPLFVASAIFFILIALLSLALTPLHLTPIEYFISLSYTLRFSLYVLLGWIIYSNTFPLLRKNIPAILTISGLGLATLGLLQFIFLPDLRFLSVFGWDPHYYRSASTFLDPNFLGAYLVLTLILLVSLRGASKTRGPLEEGPAIFSMNKIASPLRVLAMTIVYIALLTTFSRSSYGMFLIGFLTFSFFKRSVKLTFLTIILFLALLLSFQIYIRAVNRVLPLDRSQTASYRFSTWQQGFEIFLKNPIIGVGFNAYNSALKEYNLADEQFLKGHGSTTNDSSILHIAATTGVLGFGAYLLFLVSLCKAAWIKNPSFVAGVFGLLGHSFFVNSLFYPAILVWIVLAGSNLYDEKSTE